MDSLKLLVIFVAMLVLIFRFKVNLALTFALGCAAVAVAYRFDPVFALTQAVQTTVSYSTLSIVAIFYTVTFLQKMMERRGHIALAEHALLGLTNSKRLGAALAPMCVGLMPSPGAVVIGGAMVNSIYKDTVSNEDKNFVTSYFRHIPESFVPTFGAIVLACELAGVPVGDFVVCMIPMAVLLFVLGYVMFVRKLPDGETDTSGQTAAERRSVSRRACLRDLGLALWPVGVIIVFVVLTKADVYIVTLAVIAAYYLLNRFRFQEVKGLFLSSFESRLILSTIFILIFKDYILGTDVIGTLPDLFSALPLPDYLVFSLLFFVGALLVGTVAIIAIGIPLAYAAIPDGGVALLVLLSSMAAASMQISISHICLFLSSTFFKVDVSSLIRRTIPVIGVFCVLLVPYYLLIRDVV